MNRLLPVLRLKRDDLANQIEIQFMAWCGIIFLLVFCYVPMFGILVAFKDCDYSYNIMQSLVSSKWVGFEFFKEFFTDEQFADILKNTLGLNLLQLAVNFPAPIIFALLLNEIFHLKFKKAVQTITYFPYFISWIVFGGIIINFLSSETGVVNPLLKSLGLIEESIYFMGIPGAFWWIVSISSLIKGIGWASIIYLSAIASIDQTLYEAAYIDGAGRFQRIWHITLPSISGTILVFFLLSISSLLTSNFDQIWVLQNPLNLERSEVIDTFVYKVGISQMRYSYTTAVGIFKSIIALVLLAGGHFISKKTVGRGLF